MKLRLHRKCPSDILQVVPIITSSKTQPTYDVIVVGSGAGRGQAAYVLAMVGVPLQAFKGPPPEVLAHLKLT